LFQRKGSVPVVTEFLCKLCAGGWCGAVVDLYSLLS